MNCKGGDGKHREKERGGDKESEREERKKEEADDVTSLDWQNQAHSSKAAPFDAKRNERPSMWVFLMHWLL